ncbi:Dolichyl-phosphate-mannose-protein mannosyltransferase-domain-containing protein [Pyronema omphalodes]|nr:Dolichyl-phosphate-mannose-protein mannosyltransferase-domain-containing protein [Pyronema omphalodes]
MAQNDHLDVAGASDTQQRRSKSPSKKRKAQATDSLPPSYDEAVASAPPPQKAARIDVQDVDTGVKDNDIFGLPSSDYTILVLLTILAVLVRLFKISQPSSVVFDEVHFGGFATKYIKGKFFMDVHPPLAKLLITLAGWLADFDGSFDFKEIGKDYIASGVPYVAMRMFPAVCGILVVPTIFLTLKAAGCSTASATLAAGLIIFDNALATQSRLILLDAPLVIFTALTGLAWTCFLNIHEQGHKEAFSFSWWFWLTCTGLGLGATASVKWVGLFTIAWVGSLTILQLWQLLGDTKNVSASCWMKHFAARAWALIVIPVTFYMAMFAIHFTCLRNPGDGDGFMSTEFQSTLNSRAMKDVAADVAFGSKITIRHHNTQGGYLHSHASMYPTGSKQQQITLYPHKDENNVWFLENQTYPDGGVGISGFDEMDPVWVQDGAIIKLYHIATDRRLHSHDHRPPVTEADWQNEVSAYGYKGFEGDANDMFRIEIVKKLSEGPIAKERVRTIQTKFRLIHTMTGCVLFSHKVKLPAWGFEQQEVTCAKGATLPNSIWYIESNDHPKLDQTAERVNYYRPGFFGKFWELQKVMWKTNAGLVESHAWDSRPQSWPILRRGINFWGKDNRQVYLIGNPLIWWTSTAAVALYLAFKGFAVLRWQRGYKDYAVTNFRRFDYEVGVAVLAWAFHYFPFFLMQRQLFLHHYLPALYFAVVALAQVFDFVAFRIKALGLKQLPLLGWSMAVSFLALSAVVYGLYSPLVYGNPWTKSSCKQVKLFETWDWDCNQFLDSYSDYSSASHAPAAAVPTVASVAAPVVPVQEQVIQQQQVQQPIVQQPVVQQPVVQQEIPAVVEEPESMVTSPPMENVVIGTEETVEYRDQDGNLLDPEQVKALEGKVNFETKYETRYRVVDNPNELAEGSNVIVLEKDASAPQEIPADGAAEPEILERTVWIDDNGVPLPDDQQDAPEPEIKSRVVYVDEYGYPLPDSEQEGYVEPQGTGMEEVEAPTAPVAAEVQTTTDEPAEAATPEPAIEAKEVKQQVQPEEVEPETVTVVKEEPIIVTKTVEVEEPETVIHTVEVEEPKTVTVEVQEEPKVVTVEVEEPKTVTVYDETEPEVETVTVEVEVEATEEPVASKEAEPETAEAAEVEVPAVEEVKAPVEEKTVPVVEKAETKAEPEAVAEAAPVKEEL